MLIATGLTFLAIAVVGHISFVVLANRINRRLPPESKMYYFDVGPWKILGVYRRLYPPSRLYLFPWFCMGAAVLCWLVVVWQIFRL